MTTAADVEVDDELTYLGYLLNDELHAYWEAGQQGTPLDQLTDQPADGTAQWAAYHLGTNGVHVTVPAICGSIATGRHHAPEPPPAPRETNP